jgi:putative spermidine/putrescine transport system ATP-binding protein
MPVSVSSLSKRYGNKWVLRDLGAEFQCGKITGVFGPTGSGKTTLAKLLARTIDPNGGAIRIYGRDITTAKANECGVSLLSTESTGGWRALFSGSRSSISAGERDASLFRDFLKNSGPVIVLDDPFRKMDTAVREDCFAECRTLAATGELTIIFFSSDFCQILELADKAAFLDQGEIIQTGTPAELYENPVSKRAALLTGDNNLITARRITKSNAEVPEFHTIDGGHRIFAEPVERSRMGPINQNVTLAIRPEQVVMSMGASFPEDNLIRATVTGIRSRGATSLIDLDSDGLKLTTRVFKVVGLNVGDECMLGLPPHRICVLRD